MALPNLKQLVDVTANTSSATKGIANSQKTDDSMKGVAKQQSSFFDKLLANDKNKDKIEAAKASTAGHIARQDKNIEQRMLLRRIARNTDEMVDLLRDLKTGDKTSNKSLLDLLKWLGLGLLAAPGLIAPEATKPVVAGVKAGAKAVPAALKAAGATAEAASAAAKAAGKVGAGVHAAGAAGKALGKIGAAAGKVGDSKIVNKGIRYASGAMIGGRLIQEDYTGAGMEAASLGMHEAARKVKNPKAKLALTIGSLATDAAIIGRDLWNGHEEKKKQEFAKENDIVLPEKESIITKVAGWAGLETDQAKRIKEQEAAMTPEKKAVMENYDNSSSIFGGNTQDNIGTITKIITGVTAGILAALGIKSLLNKGIPGIKPGSIAKESASVDTAAKNVKPQTTVPKTYTPVDAKHKPKVLAPPKNVSNLVAAEAAETAGKKVLTKGAAGMAGKLIPGAGLALGAYGAVSRASDGDYVGAAAEAVSGLATLIPGVGTAIGAVIQGGLLYRDYVKATSQDTGELNKITKEATSTLGKSAEANTKTVDANGKSIQKSNETLVKNSDEMKKATDGTGTLLKTFTNALGMGVFGWITMGGKVFNEAFKVLSDVSGKLWDWVKNSSIGQVVSTGINAVSGAIDTAGGQASLGKHGGTMTGSIFAGESGGNYGVYNVKQNGKYVAKKVDQNNTSLNTIMNMQDNKQMNAFGAYQIIGSTMKGAKKALGLTGNEKMTQQLQDRIYQDYLVKEKRKDMYKYLTGGNNLNGAITAAAMEWASIGVPVAMKGDKRQVQAGESYYAGDGHNKASISPSEFGEGLKQQRNRYLALKKAGLNEKDAYHKSFDKNALSNVSNIKKEDKKGTGGEEASTLQKIVNGASDGISAIGKAWDNSAPGKVFNAATSDPTAKKGVDGTQPLSDKNIPKPAAKPAEKAAAKQTIKPETKDTKNKATTAAATTPVATPAKDQKGNSAKGDAEWDLDVLCSHAISNAKPKSTSKCALFVRRALEAAQLKTWFSGGLGDAKQMPARLVKMGWKSVGENLKSFKKGDIIVFQKTTTPAGKKAGHVQIYTGKVFVSDFVQPNVQPVNGHNLPYTVYRAIKGYSNGVPIGASAGSGGIESEAGNSENVGGGGDDPSAAEEKKDAGEKLVDGFAKLLAFVGDSDAAKTAVDWLDSVQIDQPKKENIEKADLYGSDSTLYGQLDNGFKYKGGNGGAVNEDSLFNPNLERQQGAKQDLLGAAGNKGIQRQQDVGRNLLGNAGYINPQARQLNATKNWLGNAGYIDPNMRQEASKYDLLAEAGKIDGIQRQHDVGRNLLGEAGYIGDIRQGDASVLLQNNPGYGSSGELVGTGGYNDIERNTKLDEITKELESKNDAAKPKKKKLKWYDKLFGDSNSWLGQLSQGLGLGGLFGFGQDIYKTSKNDEWGDFALKKLEPIANENGLGEVFGIGKDIYDTSKNGEWGNFAGRAAATVLSHKDDHLYDKDGNLINNTTNNDNIFNQVLSETTKINPGVMVPENIPPEQSVAEGDFKLGSIKTNPDGTSIYTGPDGRIVRMSSEGDILSIDRGDDKWRNKGVTEEQLAAIDSQANNNKLEPGTIQADLAPQPENNIIPTVKEDTNGNRTYYNGDGSTVTRDFEGKLLGQTPPTTNVPNRLEDVKPRLIAPGEENQVKPMAPVLSTVPAASTQPVANSPLEAVLARQSSVDNAFAKLRSDKIANKEISDKLPDTKVNLVPDNKYKNGVLLPDNESRETLDDHVAKINRQHEQSKANASGTAIMNNTPSTQSSGSIPSANANKNGGAGLSAPIVTRNPDSIFREVSITMMKASTT